MHRTAIKFRCCSHASAAVPLSLMSLSSETRSTMQTKSVVIRRTRGHCMVECSIGNASRGVGAIRKRLTGMYIWYVWVWYVWANAPATVPHAIAGLVNIALFPSLCCCHPSHHRQPCCRRYPSATSMTTRTLSDHTAHLRTWRSHSQEETKTYIDNITIGILASNPRSMIEHFVSSPTTDTST